MKQLIQRMSILLLLFCLSPRASAQITLVKNGKASSRIVLVEKNEVNEQAATLLQDFVKRISQATLPIVTDTKARSGDILIGGKQASVGEDVFLLKTTANEQLQISSGGDKGAIYGVVTLFGTIPRCILFCKRGLYIDSDANNHTSRCPQGRNTGIPLSPNLQL
ncbi:hypothetical protein PN628_23290 [Parabacteroides distasonis]|uniref:hypothetical protein n=1 Tax=Parabacteroides distasonis TaxID=823 RepID=UPI00232D14CF|nr:hypothetical protein [Parabacteroides distasonis]MDB9154393.1 hypothetical protein [Parabacteroides distasonis]MDB9158937.1 hypothetical protein [Parabacteroides distasonis]MDB9167710.1 hypothetical protein [Parabacteroides distasonis]MDB9172248.1 hypothetical protein [Parabacteroides distasonis]MDB9197456.1 hypothetical protein [Parabacteroides distasonis]